MFWFSFFANCSGSVTELPCKLPHYVAIVHQLSQSVIVPPTAIVIPTQSQKPIIPLSQIPGLPAKPVASEDEPAATEPMVTETETTADVEMNEVIAINVGQEIILDIMKALQVYLDERKWRNVRYCVSKFELNHLN